MNTLIVVIGMLALLCEQAIYRRIVNARFAHQMNRIIAAHVRLDRYLHPDVGAS